MAIQAQACYWNYHDTTPYGQNIKFLSQLQSTLWRYRTLVNRVFVPELFLVDQWSLLVQFHQRGLFDGIPILIELKKATLLFQLHALREDSNEIYFDIRNKNSLRYIVPTIMWISNTRILQYPFVLRRQPLLQLCAEVKIVWLS